MGEVEDILRLGESRGRRLEPSAQEGQVHLELERPVPKAAPGQAVGEGRRLGAT